MHHVGVALDLHESLDLHRARPRHSAHVVAPEVDQHHVLGPLLEVGEQLALQRGVLGRFGAPSPRARERPRLDALAFYLDELLG